MNAVRLLHGIANVVTLLILVDVIASWVPSLNRNELVGQVRRLTDPILAPFRRILPPETLGIDVSPIAAIFAIRLIVGFLTG